ncbi:hypothetical protein AN478_04520 [Thiohalorhabdus denitrificans]|uniref:Uncharacterized protein n=1 Tax=Thiohalorhabdus denitrificans TaxID=381306 RepID=A0A0N8PNC8_9GAMM|nr:hypothetical protein [Thiohalorhabdus denitrificans]KPV41165.1 hypothetical protein AN478_04520 [Thiohalorhabdus denitrificans]SCY36013.1 hypothetical protein SAMN05661077_1872 [Thiohalorhabdus denitrificans]
MAYTFQSLDLPPEEEMVPAGEGGDVAWVDVDLNFRDDETGLEPMVRVRVPVAYGPVGNVDQMHSEAVRAAEDLAQLAASHLEENDVDSLVRMAMGG